MKKIAAEPPQIYSCAWDNAPPDIQGQILAATRDDEAAYLFLNALATRPPILTVSWVKAVTNEVIGSVVAFGDESTVSVLSFPSFFPYVRYVFDDVFRQVNTETVFISRRAFLPIGADKLNTTRNLP